jgi:hypothetical protein
MDNIRLYLYLIYPPGINGKGAYREYIMNGVLALELKINMWLGGATADERALAVRILRAGSENRPQAAFWLMT